MVLVCKMSFSIVSYFQMRKVAPEQFRACNHHLLYLGTKIQVFVGFCALNCLYRLGKVLPLRQMSTCFERRASFMILIYDFKKPPAGKCLV